MPNVVANGERSGRKNCGNVTVAMVFIATSSVFGRPGDLVSWCLVILGAIAAFIKHLVCANICSPYDDTLAIIIRRATAKPLAKHHQNPGQLPLNPLLILAHINASKCTSVQVERGTGRGNAIAVALLEVH